MSTLDQLKARAAIAMVELSQTHEGLICRQWAVTRRFQTLEQVEVWLERFDDSAPSHTRGELDAVQPMADKQGGEYAPPKE